MAKALVFSDLHIHDHKDRVERLDDCLKVLEWIFETAAERDVDYIFFLGDLFHERSKIDTKNYMITFDVFMKHMLNDASTRQMFLLVGNHDMYHKESCDINSVKPLSAIPRISIVQNPVSMELGGRKIDWLPYSENPIEDLNNFKKKGVGDILFAHIAVSGASTNTFYGVRSDVIVEHDKEMVRVDASLFEDWDMAMFGHYHGAQPISKKAEYVGSPLQLTFGEVFQQKHLIILDLETMEKEYVVNDFSPKHLIVSEQDVENCAYDLTGQFVRITSDDMGKKNLIDLQRKIAREYKPLTVDVKQNDRKAEDKDHVQIWDVTSTCKFAKRHLTKRKQFYKEANYPFTQEKLEWK